MEIWVLLVLLVTFNIFFVFSLVSIGFTRQNHDISLNGLDLLSGTLILVHPCGVGASLSYGNIGSFGSFGYLQRFFLFFFGFYWFY